MSKEPTQTIGEGLTFEKVWAALMKTRKTVEENGRQIKKTQAETAR